MPRSVAKGPFIDARLLDRKSTRLNSSHPSISYAVFCLKKKKKVKIQNLDKKAKTPADTNITTGPKFRYRVARNTSSVPPPSRTPQPSVPRPAGLPASA